MAEVRHMFVDLLNLPRKWIDFARPIKIANMRRPAFQAEMAGRMPGLEKPRIGT